MKSSATEPDYGAVTVLTVGPMCEDHLVLQDIVQSPGLELPAASWTLKARLTPRAVLEELRSGQQIPIVICECDRNPGAWKELLEQLVGLPQAPVLIVTSRQADDRLWVEALNLGAYDVLAQPFDRKEVSRTLTLAFLHWKNSRKAKSVAAA